MASQYGGIWDTLEYVVRPDIAVKTEAEDPAYGYDKVDKEMTKRAHHTGRAFVDNRRKALLIPQVRPARTYSISPWEMNHLPREIDHLPREIDQQAYNLIRITRLWVTSHSQPLINAQHLMASYKLLVKNNK
jgi:hypothetical protein